MFWKCEGCKIPESNPAKLSYCKVLLGAVISVPKFRSYEIYVVTYINFKENSFYSFPSLLKWSLLEILEIYNFFVTNHGVVKD